MTHLLSLVLHFLDFLHGDRPADLYLHLVLQLPLLVERAPIVGVVVFVALPVQQVQEDVAEVGVVWLVLELKCSAVVEVYGEFYGQMAALYFYGDGHLLLHDFLVFLHFVVSTYSLPRQVALH